MRTMKVQKSAPPPQKRKKTLILCEEVFFPVWWFSMFSRGAGGRGQSSPQRLLTWKFLLTYREKRGKEKGKGVKIEKKRRKIVKGKVEKLQNEERTFCFSLFKTTKICFRSTKMEIFYREKAFHTGEKIRKNDFAPSEKFSCYTSDK